MRPDDPILDRFPRVADGRCPVLELAGGGGPDPARFPQGGEKLLRLPGISSGDVPGPQTRKPFPELPQILPKRFPLSYALAAAQVVPGLAQKVLAEERQAAGGLLPPCSPRSATLIFGSGQVSLTLRKRRISAGCPGWESIRCQARRAVR